MPLDADVKKQIMTEYATVEGDTGSRRRCRRPTSVGTAPGPPGPKKEPRTQRRCAWHMRKKKARAHMEGPDITFAEAVIDNGSFGTRTVRFETGRLARQAGGAVTAYLDDDTMLLS